MRRQRGTVTPLRLSQLPTLLQPSPGNGFGEAGGVAIGKALETNCTLAHLNLSCELSRPCPRMLPSGRGVVVACRRVAGCVGRGGRCVRE